MLDNTPETQLKPYLKRVLKSESSEPRMSFFGPYPIFTSNVNPLAMFNPDFQMGMAMPIPTKIPMPIIMPVPISMGTPFMGYPTGLTADQTSAIAKFDAEFPDMQKKMNYLSSVPNLSPQLLKEYYDIKSEFNSFESANSKTNITFANADKISVCSRLQSMKTKIDNLYNLVSGMAMYNPLVTRPLPTVVTTITTTPVPSPQGSGSSMPSDIADMLRKLHNERM